MNVRLTPKQKIQILNSTDVYKVMQHILLRENKIRRNQEHFWVVGLNNQNKILFIELVSLGGSNRVNVAPPEVFRMGIYKNATKMILVHNHPGQTTHISPADKNFTDRLFKAGKFLLIEVIDHLVITEKNYFSFGDEGLIEEIRYNGNFELMHKDEIALLELKMEEKKIKELATKMKSKGYTVDQIMEVTGLKKSVILKL